MNSLQTIGPVEKVDLLELRLCGVPARVDTGAKTSAIWASDISEDQGILRFVLFGPGSPFYTGEMLQFHRYGLRTIISSMGDVEKRYVVRMLVSLSGRKIRATFTLANRSQQAYPMLVGRNILRGKFVVDVMQEQPLINKEFLSKSAHVNLSLRGSR
jgi:hypothetical protein